LAYIAASIHEGLFGATRAEAREPGWLAQYQRKPLYRALSGPRQEYEPPGQPICDRIYRLCFLYRAIHGGEDIYRYYHLLEDAGGYLVGELDEAFV
jgi:hypothetical protein